jgi:nucleoside 2-deoxyribosyltransferase
VSKHKDEDWSQNPAFRRYAKRVREELIPMIEDSAITMSLVPPGNKPDVKFAVELGFMIMLDKPIIAIVDRDSKPPAKLIAVADEIVEGQVGDPDFEERLKAAIDRVMAKVKERDAGDNDPGQRDDTAGGAEG